MEPHPSQLQNSGDDGDVEMREYEKMVEAQQKETGKVTREDFHMLSVIGKGSYGKVLLVKLKGSNELYAMKILKKGEIVRRN
jgi:protein-serine/threonine kinase